MPVPRKDKKSAPDNSHLAAQYLVSNTAELLHDRRRFAWLSFRSGVYRGIGFTLGTILVLVIISTLVTLVGGWPYIGDFVKNIQIYLTNSAR